jgi:uncharacterized protein
MLNPAAIDYLSSKLYAFCKSRGAKYTASMFSNGTSWPEKPEDTVAFVKRNHIRELQFTFDGLPEHHNKRRRYLAKGMKRSSFEALSHTISSLIGHAYIALRINCDPGNFCDVYALIDLFVERGWLYPGSGVYPYAARIRPVTETCDFLHNYNVDASEFNKLDNDLKRYVSRFVDPREAALRLYPKAIKLVCAAMNPNGLMIGPDGVLYKCTEDMGSHKMSQGNIRDRVQAAAAATLLPIISQPQGRGSSAHDYDGFSPFNQPTCSVCKYLPQCMSGCPKQQLEKHRINQNRANIDAFRQYWDDSLELLVTGYADIAMSAEQRPEPVVNPNFEEYIESLKQEAAFSATRRIRKSKSMFVGE